MVSTKLLVIALVLCILVAEIYTKEEAPQRPNRRNHGNNNRSNRAGSPRARQGNRNMNRPRNGAAGLGENGQRCEEIELPMCKGLVGYTRTKLPNRFNHTTQLQVYRVLEHMWALIDRGCSHNFRLLACSLFLPKCVGNGAGREPCLQTCKKTKQVCENRLEQFGYTWPEQFDCDSLPKKRCLKMERHNSCTIDHTMCVPIDIPMCQGLSFDTGLFPNMFGQCHRAEIITEMSQFQPLIDSNCSPKLGFFLCGVYMPFCTHTEGGLSFPCQELCSEVRDACAPVYQRLSGGLPWPNKFQCHRYPLSTNENFTCVMPNEGLAPTA